MPRIGENLEVLRASDIGNTDRSLFVCCRDRESKDERWVVASLSEKQARELYRYLDEYFK